MSAEFHDIITERSLNRKIRLSVILVTLLFLFVFSRLVYLQILKGGIYSKLSTSNRIRVTKLPAPRGIIFSKSGQVLVKNKPSFDLTLVPQDTENMSVVLEDISSLLGISNKTLKQRVEKKRGRPPFEPITLKKELTWAEMSLILSRKMDLRGVSIDVVPTRLYGSSCRASHVFGFLGEISRDELNASERAYDIGDLVGKHGLERWGQSYLHGKKGGLQTEVDVYGHRQKILAEIEPVPGSNMVVSLVPELQRQAEICLQEKRGAVVAMNPSNGEVLVLASSPGFDPNLFSRGIEYSEWQKLITNPDHPLLNRAIQSQQPPGSIFKIVTLIAALEENIVSPDFKVFCPGHFQLGNRTFECWKKEGHGMIDMRQALVQSCDVFFYTLALRVGIDTIAEYADMLGFGQLTGIELENEKKGLLPSPQGKRARLGTSWQKGETLNVAIGQGFLLTTPLQAATVYSGVINGGMIPKPRIVLEVKGQLGRKIFPFEKVKEYSLSQKTRDFIVDALSGVVNDTKGTGGRARVRGIDVAGKTGTAQVASLKDDEDEKETPRHLRDHAWFVGFAPAAEPEIVVCTLIEHGGHGGSVAAPVVQKILQTYFDMKNQSVLQ